MRHLALIFTLILPFVFVIPAQAAGECECESHAQMGAACCGALSVDCCFETSPKPAHPFDWTWERSLTQTTPQLVQLATLAPLDVSVGCSIAGRFPCERPPPKSARSLRTFQQSWLI